MKSIKEEAERELKVYREQKEKEYQQELDQVIIKIFIKIQLKKRIQSEGEGDSSAQSANVEQLQREYTKNKEQVVDLLVKNVLAVNIEIPKVVKGTFE